MPTRRPRPPGASASPPEPHGVRHEEWALAGMPLLRPYMIICRVSEHLNCLIVDDSAVFRDAAARALRHEGCGTVKVAADFQAALDILAEWPADVVLVDVHLADASGVEVALELRRTAHVPPAIVLISSRHDEDLEDAVAATDALLALPKEGLSCAALRRALAGRVTRTPDSGAPPVPGGACRRSRGSPAW